MDLRVKKTQKSIRDAFISIRAHKSLDKISVKELCEKAMINKATFYLHYKSIYDLSEALENELIEDCFLSVEDADIMQTDKVVFEFYRSFSANSRLFRILFSDSRIQYAVVKADAFLKERIYSAHPDKKNDLEFNVRLTALTYGCFYAYLNYKDDDLSKIIPMLASFAKKSLL